MFCPLRKKIDNVLNMAEFGDCYKNKCEWWVPGKDNKPGACAVQYIGVFYFLTIVMKEKQNGKP